MIRLHQTIGPLALLLLALALLAPTGAFAQTRDVAGARDFPGIGRFGGSVITGWIHSPTGGSCSSSVSMDG